MRSHTGQPNLDDAGETLGSAGSDDASDRCGSYSLSADVSESDFSGELRPMALRYPCSTTPVPCGCNGDGASSSFASSPLQSVGPVSALFPVNAAAAFWDARHGKHETELSEVEMMKERFAKLLLGEDMSGSGKGVCSALAISNAITNLSATVFGELWRLEPLAAQKKAMWRREMTWLLSVSDFIVQLTPTLQEFPGVGKIEVMLPHLRSDLQMNLPALKKLDAMLLVMLDEFRETEFWYVDRGVLLADEDDVGASGGVRRSSSSLFGRASVREEDKWWLPCPRVPAKGLSEVSRKKLQQCRDCANQILKAAMSINSGVLAEMEIPDAFVESLPKTGKSCLGDIIYQYITADQFSPECLLDFLDLSSEHHTLEVANRIEAAVHVWKQKGLKKHAQSKTKKASWGGKVRGFVSDTERSQLLAERAEGLLHSLRIRYPGLPQSLLDMNKIQYNKDVGQSILESYSRVIESLAFNVIARIDDVLFVDDATKRSAAAESVSIFNRGLGGLPVQKRISPSPFSIQNTPYASPCATPAFCATSPESGSPGRALPPLSKNLKDLKRGKIIRDEVGKTWTYTGNLSVRKDSSDAQERD